MLYEDNKRLNKLIFNYRFLLHSIYEHYSRSLEHEEIVCEIEKQIQSLLIMSEFLLEDNIITKEYLDGFLEKINHYNYNMLYNLKKYQIDNNINFKSIGILKDIDDNLSEVIL